MANGNHGKGHKFTVKALVWGSDPEAPAGIELMNGMFLCRKCCRAADKMAEPPDLDLEVDPTDPVLCCRCFQEII